MVSGSKRRESGAPSDDAEETNRAGLTRTTTSTAHMRLRWFVKSGRKSQLAGYWLRRAVRESSPASLLNVVVRPFWGRLGGGEMTADHVLEAVGTLEAEGLRFWVAGGWGVDLLNGSPTRKHSDLDIVLANYEDDEPLAVRALEGLGYRHVRTSGGDEWMSPRHLLNDGEGHLVELLGLNRSRLAAAFNVVEITDAPVTIEDRMPELFCSGTLGGRSVPCLSAHLQLLFHSGFDPRGIDKHDLHTLRELTPPHGSAETIDDHEFRLGV
jgi:lincosamide nucleotidyltransferase A/C/D/E